jgi:hypothetical protein
MGALLYSMTPQGTQGFLTPDSQRLLGLVERLEKAGAKFYEAPSNPLKKHGRQTMLPVQAIWHMWDHKLQIGFKDQVSGEERFERVDSEDGLRSLIGVIEPKPAEQAQAPAPPAEQAPAQPATEQAPAQPATEQGSAPPQGQPAPAEGQPAPAEGQPPAQPQGEQK